MTMMVWSGAVLHYRCMRAGTIFSFFLVLVVFVYAFFRAQSFLFGPTLTVLFPASYERVSQEFTLRGFTENATYLSINDRRIYPDEEGFFEKDLILPAGYTIVKLYAYNRQKRERIIYLPLYIQPYATKEKDAAQKSGNKEVRTEDGGY